MYSLLKKLVCVYVGRGDEVRVDVHPCGCVEGACIWVCKSG